MKRLFCIVLAVCLLTASGLCESDWYEPEEGGDDWALLDSRFGFSLWYPEDMMCLWTEEFNDETAEWLCPMEDESGVAAMICRGSRFSALLWDGYTRISRDEPEVWLNYPYEMTAYTDGDIISEQWIISAPDRDYVFIIQYETGDYQGWAPLFHEILGTVEFPDQPAVTADFRLDYAQSETQFPDIVVDEDADPMTLTALGDVTDFVLELVDWENMEISSVSVLCIVYKFSPGDGLCIYAYIPDMLPNLRFRYRDANGEEKCWYISQSGRDGSLLMIGPDDL